jgi:hypothetical protein
MKIFISGKNHYRKVLIKYINYLIAKILSVRQSSKLYGINLKYKNLLKEHNIGPKKQYYKMLNNFLLRLKIVTPVKYKFKEPSENTRKTRKRECELFDVHLYELVNILNIILEKTNYEDYPELPQLKALEQISQTPTTVRIFIASYLAKNTKQFKGALFTKYKIIYPDGFVEYHYKQEDNTLAEIEIIDDYDEINESETSSYLGHTPNL